MRSCRSGPNRLFDKLERQTRQTQVTLDAWQSYSFPGHPALYVLDHATSRLRHQDLRLKHLLCSRARITVANHMHTTNHANSHDVLSCNQKYNKVRHWWKNLSSLSFLFSPAFSFSFSFSFSNLIGRMNWYRDLTKPIVDESIKVTTYNREHPKCCLINVRTLMNEVHQEDLHRWESKKYWPKEKKKKQK